MLTKVELISLALFKIGKDSITNLDQNPLAVAASKLYDFLLQAELTTGIWRFATIITQLNQLSTPPNSGNFWKFQYALPADFDKVVRMHPHTYDFDIFKNQLLYSNISGPLSMEYVSSNVLDTDLPPYFCKFFALQIAAWLAAGNAQNPQLTGMIQEEAVTARLQALAADAQNRPSTPLMSAPAVNSRTYGIWGNSTSFFDWWS